MIKLSVVTLAALFAILHVFGDDTRRPLEVTRSAPVGLEVVDASVLAEAAQSIVIPESTLSETEAVQLAIAAGRKLRLENSKPKLGSLVVASAFAADTAGEGASSPQPKAPYWYVTGNRVNLREGPGTSNPVVGQVTLGMEAEVLSNQDGWFEIRLANGAVSGWISGKFLNENRPG